MKSGAGMDKKLHFSLWYLLAAIIAMSWIQDWWTAYRAVEPIPYSQFEELLASGQVESVTVGDRFLRGKLKQPLPDGREQFVTTRVDPAIAGQLAAKQVRFEGAVESNFLTQLLSWVLPAMVFFAIWSMFMRRLAGQQGVGGLMSIGKSKAKVYVESDTKITFDEVAGVDEAKAELQEVVNFLKEPSAYARLGARIPKGILLVGPPGTGKTLLARAVAGEAKVPFFSISGSEFVEMFVGVGAARVRDLFEQARSHAPCIIFIDELDALGRARTIGGGFGGHDEKEQTLNQLLAELDGFDPSGGIVLLAATNRPEILDPALLRAGRFDRQVLVDRPDKRGREAILKVHVRKVQLGTDVDVAAVAALTPGFSGAELANLVNEAALRATRRGGEAVSMDDFTNAIERIVAGLEKRSRLMNPREREVVANHELGHALVAASIPGMDPVHKVSIIPRGIGALGYTMQRPTEDRFLMSRSELCSRMAVLLGGRAAEALVFGEFSTGAADDLDRATDIARHMVTRFGMSEKLGQAVYEPQRTALLGEGIPGISEPRQYSEDTAREIDCEIRQLVDTAFREASAILTRRRADLEAGARLLLDKETLTVAEFPPMQSAGTATA